MADQLPPELKRFLRTPGSDPAPDVSANAVGRAIDLHSSQWVAQENYMRYRAEGAQQRLESAGLPERQSDYERGYIAAMREIIKLPYEARGIR